jgi:hypothetical protein
MGSSGNNLNCNKNHLSLFIFYLIFRFCKYAILMALESYAWFIYILTFLLTFAIICIAFLIIYKCIQTCKEMRILCCKKMRRRRRHRREANANGENTRNERRLSLSSTSSFTSSDSSDMESTSSCSEDSSVYQLADTHTITGDHSSILLERGVAVGGEGFVNDGYNANPNEIRFSKKLKKNVINRKYDDASRYEKKMSERNVNAISSKHIDSQSYQINHLLNRITSNRNLNKTGQTSSMTCQLAVNTLLETALNLPQVSGHSKLDGDVSFLSHPTMFDINVDDDDEEREEEEASFKFEIDNEIPPPYEQIVNRESTV